jgi:hypothetical protein
MTSTIQIKRSSTAGNVPSTLQDGELAINEADEVLFYKNVGGIIQRMSLPSAPLDALASTGFQINGNMEVDQEHQGAAVAVSNGSGPYIVDQWQASFIHTANTAAFQAGQTPATGPNLNGTGLYLRSNTALVSPNIGDYAVLQQPVEGYRWGRLNYGLSSAHNVSIGFWFWGSVAGTGSVAIRNAANTRSYVTNFTTSLGGIWNWVTVTIPGDQVGTWLGGSSIGAYISFCFVGGSTFRTAANAWFGGNAFATAQNTNFFATNGNQVIITGVVILSGPNMPSVSRAGLLLRPSTEELSLCQRYLWSSVASAFSVSAIGNAFSPSCYIGNSFLFPVKMRANPTVTLVGIGVWPVANVSQPVCWASSADGFSLYALSVGAGNGYFYADGGGVHGVKADARM